MGVLPVLEALSASKGLVRFCGCSGGVRVASPFSAQSTFGGSFSSNTFSEILKLFCERFFKAGFQ